jgi:hypothetical protein
MDVNAILCELYSELRRIDRAILDLQQLAPLGNGHEAGPLYSDGAIRNAREVDLIGNSPPRTS